MIPDPEWMRREKTHKNGHDYEKGKKRGSTPLHQENPRIFIKKRKCSNYAACLATLLIFI